MRRCLATLLAMALLTVRSGWGALPTAADGPSEPAALASGHRIHLPTVQRTNYEFRALWVTRWEWHTADDLRGIVAKAADAGFNVLLFQVRGEADAFYTPGLEPWSRLLTGTLGRNPGWDPLAVVLQEAHARGLQVHAYVNVYPVWNTTSVPPEVSPRPAYWLLQDWHGGLAGLQQTTGGSTALGGYYRASPGSERYVQHLEAVVRDLASRYAIDGLHLDHARYGSSDASCDAVSLQRYGTDACPLAAGEEVRATYQEWQRERVNEMVQRIYRAAVETRPGIWVTAAVWPVYKAQDLGWSVQDGYNTYYQDSKRWLRDGYVDALMPMIYPSSFSCPDTSFWNRERYNALVRDYQNAGAMIIPGIGGGYCSFDEIAARITMARAAGASGQAIFAYSWLNGGNYWDALRSGPYAEPAQVPPLPAR